MSERTAGHGHGHGRGQDHGHGETHVVGVGLYLAVFIALLVLTGLTVWSARHDFGALNTPVAMGIAVVKATLVILFFMHVKYSSRLVQLIVACAFVWLSIMIVGILHDYYSPRVTPAQVPLPALSRE